MTRPSPAVAQAAPTPMSGVWFPRPTGLAAAYVVDQVATVRIEQDSTTQVDSVASRTNLSFSTTSGGRFAGTITAFHALGAGQTYTSPPGLVFPLPFSGAIGAKGLVELAMPSAGVACTATTLPVVATSRDLWLRAPDTLRIGTVWDDSSSTLTCRDGIPLRATVVRTYRVDRVDPRDVAGPVLVVSRSQRMALDGAGTQWGEAVRISGTGTGRMTLTLSTETGALVEATGRSTLDLTFTSARRAQRVQQVAVTNVAPTTKK